MGGIASTRIMNAIEQTKSVYDFENDPDPALYFAGSYLPGADMLMLK